MGEICVVYKRASTNDTPVSSLSEHFQAFEIWYLGAVNVFSAMFLTVVMERRQFLENLIIDSAKFCQQLHCTLINFHIVINKWDEWWWFIACDFRIHTHTRIHNWKHTFASMTLAHRTSTGMSESSSVSRSPSSMASSNETGILSEWNIK